MRARSPDARARVALTVAFVANGIFFGTLAARIPAIKDRLGLSDGALGVALLFVAVGVLCAFPLVGRLIATMGSRPVTRIALVLDAAAIGLVGLAPSLAGLIVAAFILGAANAALDVGMNAHGVALERRYGRPILSSLPRGLEHRRPRGRRPGRPPRRRRHGRPRSPHRCPSRRLRGGARDDPRPPARRGGHGPPAAGAPASLPARGHARADRLLLALRGGRRRRLERRLPQGLARGERGPRGRGLRRLRPHDGRRPHRGRPPHRPVGAVGLLVRCGLVAGAGLATALVIGHPAAGIVGFALLGRAVARSSRWSSAPAARRRACRAARASPWSGGWATSG